MTPRWDDFFIAAFIIFIAVSGTLAFVLSVVAAFVMWGQWGVVVYLALLALCLFITRERGVVGESSQPEPGRNQAP